MTTLDLAPNLRFQTAGFHLRRTLGAGVVLFVALAACGNAFAWGPGAHRLVNNWAVQTLPPEIRGFFAANRQYLADHANDPVEWMEKDRYERKQHYLYLDKYGKFPYLELPHSFRRAVERYGSGRINRNGLLPWQIGEYSLRLTNALKAHDWEEAKEVAAALGHYVADTHDPLHTTENYDGQLTGQPGLADRFGSQVVDRYQSFFILRPDSAMKIDDPTDYAFAAVLESHTWVDQIILADRLAVRDLMGYNDDYFDRFYSRVGSFMIRQINLAIHDTGSYWYTAWLNAGRPPLPGR
ncbi:MAG TPA: hypothetical protein VM182_07345 [Terriglobia bacterium]|nr:hypothetical protein [Terriglobia bacterium]